MNQIYELTTLSVPLLSVAKASEGARTHVADPATRGELLGCWRTDIGTLGRLLILRRFETAEDLAAERRRVLLSTNPFNAVGVATALEMDSYAPFPFLPPAKPGAHSNIYEFRTYKLKPGGLPATLAAWQQAIGPAHEYTAHLVINMYALDGAPRITHIWGFSSLEERALLRSRSYEQGIWPPKGGPDSILEATSTIALPESYSPLR